MGYKTTIEIEDSSMIALRAIQAEKKKHMEYKPSLEKIIQMAISYYLTKEENQKIIQNTLKGLDQWMQTNTKD